MKTQKQKKVVIFGAGITGLAVAYYLSSDFDVTVFEKESFIGGSAAGFNYKEFTLDYGPHKIYSELPGIIEEMKKISNLIKVKKINSIYLGGNYYDFPLKIGQVATKMPLTALKSGIDLLTKPFTKRADDSYENFLINRFGKTLYELSFRDYAFKVWNSNPVVLDRELARKRVAVSNIFELIKGILFKDSKKFSAEYFYYPENGMKQFFEAMERKIKDSGGKIRTLSQISELAVKGNSIKHIKIGKRKINPDYVISTIPLDRLIKATKPNKEILRYSSMLNYQSLNIIYFVLNKPRALKDCWIFFPERKFAFQRVSEQKAFSSFTSPKDKTCIMVETTKPLNAELIKEITAHLEEAKIIKESEIDHYFFKHIQKAYPVYKKGFLHNLNKIEEFFESLDNFYLLGRQGLFNYNNMDQCWDMAMKLSTHIKENRKKEDWKMTKKYFENYKIVD